MEPDDSDRPSVISLPDGEGVIEIFHSCIEGTPKPVFISWDRDGVCFSIELSVSSALQFAETLRQRATDAAEFN